MNAAQANSIILIIDDNATNLGVLTGYLRRHGFQLMIARNGADGIEKARLGQPDLILLDVMMPDMDGFETCRRLKAMPETTAIPIIFITALQSVEDKVRGFTVGGVDYITKPLQEEEVLARVRTHVQLQTQKNQLQQEIAERKQVAAKLRESEEYYRNLLNISPDAISVVDLEGRVVFLSPKSYALRGIPPDVDMVGVSVFDWFEPAEHPRLRERIAQVAAKQMALPTEYRARRSDGAPVWVELTSAPVIDAQGNVTGIMTLTRDITERKRSEAALQESEKRFKSAFQHSAIGMALVSPEGKWLQVNAKVCEIVGYAEVELLTKTFQDITHPDDLEKDLKYVRQLLAGEIESYTMEKRYIHKDGHIVWVVLAVSLVRDEVGTPLYFISQIEDITERKQAEEALQESEVRLQFLVASNPAIIYTSRVSGDYGVTFMSTSVAAILGYNPGEFIRDSEFWANHIHPDDAARVLAEFPRLFEQGVHTHEYRFLHKNGDWRWIRAELKLIRDAAGNPLEIIGSMIDITERKVAEEKIRQQHLLLEQTIESLPYPFYVIDANNYTITLANSAARRGADAGAVTCHALTHNSFTPCDTTQHPCPLTEVKQTKRSAVCEHLHIDADGTPHYVEVYGFPILGDHNRVERMIEYTVDITGRKQAEEALQQAKEAAEAANRTKSVFLANMSHELRTPLNGILGYTQILKGDPHLNAKQMQAIETIHRSGEHLLALISEVLDLAKIEAGKIEMEPTDFSLEHCIQTVVEMIRIKAKEKHLGFSYHPNGNLSYTLLGDEKRLRQVLLNLLGNAVKFTLTGGVMFRVSGRAVHDTSLVTCRLSFEIEDTGIGIPAEKLAAIFRPFEQVHDPRISAQGTGLGLAISAQILRLMGSEIQVESTPGVGSRFWFEVDLPVTVSPASDKVRQIRQVRKISGIKGRPLSILIVDDQKDNRRMLYDMLTPLDFHLAEAENGQEALDQVAAFQPDLIFLDLKMPVMDGYEVLARLRTRDATSLPVIVAFSAGAYDSIRQQSMEAGCDDFLAKPFQIEELLDILEHHLDLEWEYEEAGSDTPATDQIVILPPYEELHALHEAAIIADIMDIRTQLTQLEQRDPALKPFVGILRDLTENFRLDLLREKLDAFLQQGQSSVEVKRTRPQAGRELTAEALHTLPEAWRCSLEQAAIQGNPEVIQLVIEQVRSQNVFLAEGLAALIEEFEFGAILNLLHHRSEDHAHSTAP